MKKPFPIITIILVVIFLMSWLKILPSPFRNLILEISPLMIIISLLFSAGGLEGKAKTIIKISALVILLISISLTFYSLFIIGNQGEINILYVWFVAGSIAILIYLAVLLTSFLFRKKLTNEK